jgi:predicted secreted Zn-dependent protease
MMRQTAAWLLASLVTMAPGAARADWQAVEKVETYAVTGSTGPELYASIGARGPLLRGGKRAIAYTDFELTWSRRYVPGDDACTLVSAIPKLTITYRLPKPAGQLPAPVRRLWDNFYAGIRDHERVHGEMIRTLVADIEAATVGMSVAADPKCVKIRAELKNRLSRLFETYKRRTSDFDLVEMSDGGNVQQLVLGLVNGK